MIAQTKAQRVHVVNGNRYTTGTLRGNEVVIVLSGVIMINSTTVTQNMVNHFKVERLVMSGIAGGVSPANHVGDVTIPQRRAMPMEVYWRHDSSLPAACGKPGDVSRLGLNEALGGVAHSVQFRPPVLRANRARVAHRIDHGRLGWLHVGHGQPVQCGRLVDQQHRAQLAAIGRSGCSGRSGARACLRLEALKTRAQLEH